MEEEKVSKDFTNNQQITIDIPHDRHPMTSKEELEPEYSFGSTAMSSVGCAPVSPVAYRNKRPEESESLQGCAPVSPVAYRIRPDESESLMSGAAPVSYSLICGAAPVSPVAHRIKPEGLESLNLICGAAPVSPVARRIRLEELASLRLGAAPVSSVACAAPVSDSVRLGALGAAPVSPVTYLKETSEESEDTSDWIIYRVPNKLRKIGPAAYTPQLVSIGPFHHGKSNLKAMEYYKAKYMNKFLGRSFCNHIKEEDLIHEITKEDGKLVKKAQRSYKEETFEPENKKKYRTDSKKYWEDPKNILRDACFILELFLKDHENQFRPPDEEDKKKKTLSDKEIKDNACFIFERFFRNHQTQTLSPDEEDEKYSGEYILSPWVKASIKQDLILLENQLPFFVLTQLLNFIFKHPSININEIPDYLPELKNNEGDQLADFLILITCEFFNDYYSFRKSCTEENSKNKPFSKYSKGEKEQLVSEMKPIKHFTDLVRKFMYDKTDKFPNSSYGLTRCLYSAKQLDNAGVKFGRPKDATYLAHIKIWPDVKDDDKYCCWWNVRDRRWWNGHGCCWINGCCWIDCLELKIPQLRVDDHTECIFRNVMALEQFVYPAAPRICNYIFLLDQLIDTVEDVVFLVDKEIIENWLGSNNAVASLVNKLCDQIVIPRFFYTDICDKLNKYHNKKWNVARSTLKRVYFKDIWTGSSTVVGLVILVFSFFSTYSTIKNLFFV